VKNKVTADVVRIEGTTAVSNQEIRNTSKKYPHGSMGPIPHAALPTPTKHDSELRKSCDQKSKGENTHGSVTSTFSANICVLDHRSKSESHHVSTIVSYAGRGRRCHREPGVILQRTSHHPSRVGEPSRGVVVVVDSIV
jgi:hypothetical protein